MAVDENEPPIAPWKKRDKEDMEMEIAHKTIYAPDEEFPADDVNATLDCLNLSHVRPGYNYDRSRSADQ